MHPQIMGACVVLVVMWMCGHGPDSEEDDESMDEIEVASAPKLRVGSTCFS